MHITWLECLFQFLTKNYENIFFPLSTNPSIPIGVELYIHADGSISYDRHYHLFLYRETLILNPNSILPLIPTQAPYAFHSCRPDPTPTTPTMKTDILDPRKLIPNYDPLSHTSNFSNRAQDKTSHHLQALFKACSEGPLRYCFPNRVDFNATYHQIALGENPDDSE